MTFKKYFLTGLSILLPFVFTLLIAGFFVNLITQPFIPAVRSALLTTQLFHSPYLHHESVILFCSKLLVLTFILFVVLVLGYVGRLFFMNWLIKTGDWLIHRVPIVNKIYKSCQDIVHTVFSSDTASFSQVVLVPFPFKGHASIGFITSKEVQTEGREEMVAVFIPGTPNPTMGFLLLFPPAELTPIEMNVEEAMKFIVSCGVVAPAPKIV